MGQERNSLSTGGPKRGRGERKEKKVARKNVKPNHYLCRGGTGSSNIIYKGKDKKEKSGSSSRGVDQRSSGNRRGGDGGLPKSSLPFVPKKKGWVNHQGEAGETKNRRRTMSGDKRGVLVGGGPEKFNLRLRVHKKRSKKKAQKPAGSVKREQFLKTTNKTKEGGRGKRSKLDKKGYGFCSKLKEGKNKKVEKIGYAGGGGPAREGTAPQKLKENRT